MNQSRQETEPKPKARLVFLGTGAAWRTPELGCPCPICNLMRSKGERRTRTSFWLEGPLKILVDCGPDAARQLEDNNLDRPDVVLITHEHGDHYLGLDELEAFRRRVPKDAFTPIPIYAHPLAWETIEVRFGYLLGKLLDKRPAIPDQPLDGIEPNNLTIIPFKTDHGPMPKGAVGYIIQTIINGRNRKLVYTSDFIDVPRNSPLLEKPDILIAQAHWFNEPAVNVPHHMSLQRLLDFIARWQPQEHVFLIHISDSDLLPDEDDSPLKKRPPLDPLREPTTGRPYPIPRCQLEWQTIAEQVFKDRGLTVPVTVAYDGLVVDLEPL